MVTVRVSEMTKATDFDVFYRSEHAPLHRALAMTLGDSDLAAEAIDEAMCASISVGRSCPATTMQPDGCTGSL